MIKISEQQECNGLTYAEIVKKVGEKNIADYELLQKLRNIGFKSNWKKYPQLKDFWVFVPNPDKVSKSGGCVARFLADSVWAYLNCYGDPQVAGGSLGVFLIKEKK